uniref:Non-canonical E2 ubiquitin-conjugating enzyme C-terminal domain-containing protein n=1 Tax=Tetradesmus obliquus TaxID=3088 RepID=A0A383WEX6_TETOB|eukprot:jgi/Sobl393_1/5331/SZX75639.1
MEHHHLNERLSAVLDSEGTANVSVDTGCDAITETAFNEEHQLRLKAEADALDKATRLQVAQEQLAEYASEKSQAAATVLQHAEAVEAALAALAAASSSSSSQVSGELLQQVAALKQQLADAALEAQAFSEQQQADVERLKRSSQQAQLMDVDGAVEHKRLRDDGGISSSSEDDDEQQQAEDDPISSQDEDAAATAADGSQQQVDPALAAALPVGMETLPLSQRKLGSSTSLSSSGKQATGGRTSFRERCKYIPLRLQLEERRLLRLLEAALNVSEYTDKVDILAWRSKTSRMHAQIKDFCAILSGLVVAQDYKRGQQLVADRDFEQNAEFFQDVFEIGRRYKIMNPEKMRSEFGKLMYMLMDSSDPGVQELLGFSCVRPLRTVAAFLEERGRLELLDDPLLEVATAEIVAGERPRALVQRDIKRKESARQTLARKYKHAGLTEDEILSAIYSTSDNNSYLLFNRDPIDRMIQYFTATFRPDSYEEGGSLAITGGRGGARLTHSHERQYNYVLQSLTLWREISSDMFKLWYLAEQDMLRQGAGYRLCDTGQGLNRVQGAPGVSRAMSGILGRCQQAIGGWVGSSVVHLGDHNVPNALFFLNKYTQVPQILNPVVLVLDELPRLGQNPQLGAYISSVFGSVEAARKAILTDFCRHAFDGSGADNFFDAGSCIDGRLTSAWNWCSKVEKKPYYPIFRLAGFVGFDGDWK